LLHFPSPDHEPRPHISALFHRDLESQTVIGVVRMVPPEVRIQSRCARGHTDDPEVSSGLLGEHPQQAELLAAALPPVELGTASGAIAERSSP
jgi:hypothetical protein